MKKGRVVRCCSNCGDEGHNKKSCLRDPKLEGKSSVNNVALQPRNNSGRSTQGKVKWNKDYSRLIGRHFPLEIELTEDQRGAGKLKNVSSLEEYQEGLHKFQRSTCIMCSAIVKSQCEQCKVFLCIKTKPGMNNCWKKFHTARNILGESDVIEGKEEVDDDNKKNQFMK